MAILLSITKGATLLKKPRHNNAQRRISARFIKSRPYRSAFLCTFFLAMPDAFIYNIISFV